LTSRKSRRKRDWSRSSSRDIRRESYSPPPTKKSRARKKDAVTINRWKDGKVDCFNKNGRKSKSRPKSPHARHSRGLTGRDQRSFSDHRSKRRDDSVRWELRHRSQSQSGRRVDTARRVEIRSFSKQPYQPQQHYQAGPRVNPSHSRLPSKNHNKQHWSSSECNERSGRNSYQGRRYTERALNNKVHQRFKNIRQVNNRVTRFHKRLTNLTSKGRSPEIKFKIKQRRTSNHFSSKRKRVVNTIYKTKRAELPSKSSSKSKLLNNRFKEKSIPSSSISGAGKGVRVQDSQLQQSSQETSKFKSDSNRILEDVHGSKQRSEPSEKKIE